MNKREIYACISKRSTHSNKSTIYDIKISSPVCSKNQIIHLSDNQHTIKQIVTELNRYIQNLLNKGIFGKELTSSDEIKIFVE